MKSIQLPQTSWIFPEDHAHVVQQLVRFGLLKYDNTRRLRLKSGGETDIYINLRDARSNPAAIKFISGLYAMALSRLQIDRFVEIPDSVSAFAGPLSIATDLPYITIREQAKEGRATNSRIIGASTPGDAVAVMDDVITDGDSKIVPLRECVKLGLDVLGLVVLVDRQQGWQNHLPSKGIRTNVWSGMTLHDVRRQLIESGLMERCSLKAESANPIIIALDGKSWEQILPIVDQLRPTGTILKVNDLAFALGSDWILPNLKVYGRVMLDFKLHDISNTVANICDRLRDCPPWALTIHASGGGEMVEFARRQLEGTETLVLPVTVLTSIDPKTCREIYHRLPLPQVLSLAKTARKAGAHGFVCSPEEAPHLRNLYPDAIIVCPGCRSPGADTGDQKRVATFVEARAGGANYMVGGRQFLRTRDPVLEIKRVLVDELEINLD